MISFTFTKMHKLKQVHDTFKVLQFYFHSNHCIHCNIWLLNQHSKFYIHITIGAPVKQWRDSQPQHLQNQKKHYKSIHKQPLRYQRKI